MTIRPTEARDLLCFGLLALLLLSFAGLTVKQASVWQNSYRVFSRNVALFPESHIACEHFGIALLNQGEFTAAESSFRAGLRISPNSRYLGKGLGIALAQQGRLQEAEQIFADLAIRFPEDAMVSENQGIVALLQKDVSRALRFLLQAEALPETSANAYFLLGQIYEQRKESELAEEYYQQALELDPRHFSSARNLRALQVGAGGEKGETS